MTLHRRTLLAVALAWACALATPAAAPAATAAVTAGDGWASPLTPGAPATPVRTMAPAVVLAFEAGDARYAVEVLGPGGQVAGSSGACQAVPAGASAAVPVSYAGNGAYTVRWWTPRDGGDAACGHAGDPAVASFTIDAFATVTAPQPVLLTRRPFEHQLTSYRFPVAASPGAAGVEVAYARQDLAELGTDPLRAAVDVERSRARVRFDRPGTYAVVARAVGTGAPAFASPWSAPVTVRALSPFDFAGRPSFSDDRGPRYRVEGTVRETTAKGRIAVAIRRAGGRGRKLGSVPIRSGGRFSVAFTARGSGSYELRYRFPGSATTAAGEVHLGIRIA